VRPVILITESLRFSEAAAQILRGSAEVRLADLNRHALIAAIPDADAVWVRLRHQIDREVFEAAPRLRLIATPTTGLNHLSLEEAARRDVRIVSLRGQTEFLRDIPATAEHTLALIFALVRHIPAASAHVQSGGWDRDLFCGNDLNGKTAGVIGYGRIGRMVARYLLALGMRVQAADSADLAGEPGVTLVPLNELLEQSDIVTLHASFSEQTRGLIGRSEFARMKAGTWFVNTARGELVDEDALLEALRFGRIAGAALDVLSDEQSAGVGQNRLIEYARHANNLIITPHIGGCTAESMEKTEIFLAGRVATALAALQSLCVG